MDTQGHSIQTQVNLAGFKGEAGGYLKVKLSMGQALAEAELLQLQNCFGDSFDRKPVFSFEFESEEAAQKAETRLKKVLAIASTIDTTEEDGVNKDFARFLYNVSKKLKELVNNESSDLFLNTKVVSGTKLLFYYDLEIPNNDTHQIFLHAADFQKILSNSGVVEADIKVSKDFQSNLFKDSISLGGALIDLKVEYANELATAVINQVSKAYKESGFDAEKYIEIASNPNKYSNLNLSYDSLDQIPLGLFSQGGILEQISWVSIMVKEILLDNAKAIASSEELGSIKGPIVLNFGVSGVGFLKIEAYLENIWANLSLIA